MTKYIYLGMFVFFLVSVTTAYVTGGKNVENRIKLAQQEGRIKILKVNNEADTAADKANDEDLCTMLGGCSVSN